MPKIRFVLSSTHVYYILYIRRLFLIVAPILYSNVWMRVLLYLVLAFTYSASVQCRKVELVCQVLNLRARQRKLPVKEREDKRMKTMMMSLLRR